MGRVAPQQDSPAADLFVAMRHSGCGRLALLVASEVVDNPKRRILTTHLLFPDGSEPKAGVPIRCKSCGEVMRLGPPDLVIDRGPDARQSLWQRIALKFTTAILAGKVA